MTEVTASPAKSPDVIIVGGGLIGAAILSQAARLGLSALLLEKGAFASGSTGASGAMVRVYHSSPRLNDLALTSLPVYHRFEDIYHRSCGFERTGSLYFADASTLPWIENEVTRLRRAGASLEIVTAGEGVRRFPEFQWDDSAIGIYEPQSGYVDPVLTTRAWIEDAQQQGATAREWVAVLGWLRNGDRIVGVQTSHGDIEAPQTVLAAGSWSVPLLERLPERAGMPRLRVAPIQTIDVRWGEATGPENPFPCFFDYRTRTYGRPRGPGRSTIGHGLGKDRPVSLDGETFPDEQDLSETRERVAGIAPILGRAPVEGGVRRHDGFTDDWIPHVGTPCPGLVVAVGLSGGGFKIAPAVASLAADEIAREFADRALSKSIRAIRLEDDDEEGDVVT